MLSFFCGRSIILAVLSHTQSLGLFLFPGEMDWIWKMKSKGQSITAGSGKPGISSGKLNRVNTSNSWGKCRVFLVVDWILSNRCLD